MTRCWFARSWNPLRAVPSLSFPLLQSIRWLLQLPTNLCTMAGTRPYAQAMAPGRSRLTPRRIGLIVAVVLVVTGVSAAAWWLLWVPHVRPALQEGEVYGIDVSNHQAEIRWDAVAQDDIEFAYIKASEGGDFVDARFRHNWAEAGRVGLERGAYHFFTLCRPGREQAANFLRTARPDPQALPPAVDLELAGNCSARPAEGEVYQELEEFLDLVESAWDKPVLLYVGKDWEGRYPVLDRSDRPRWLVSFLGRPSHDWTVWQLHGFARVDGVEGGVDLDVGRLDELRAAGRGSQEGG
jgi:lysozyme